MNIPCPTHAPCIDDASSLGNYSSEDPDRLLFRSTYFPNQIWDDDFDPWLACLGLCVSFVSQADADLCAQNNAKICEREKQFGNDEETFYQTCCDGVQRSVTVPEGTFWGFSQAEANAYASQFADNYLTLLCDSVSCPGQPPGPTPTLRFPQPRNRDCNDKCTVETVCFDGMRGVTIPACRVWGGNKANANERCRFLAEAYLSANVGCLIPLPRSVCKDDEISQWIVPNRTGAFVPPLTWRVFGSLPAGIQWEASGIAIRIYGTFNASGDYGFRLTLEDANGTFTYRNYLISVMEIDEPAVLPHAQQDEAYSHAISVQHGVEPRTFAVRNDSTLPDGLTLNGETGVISGTPTGYGTYTFWIVVADSEDAVCQKEFTLTIDPNMFGSIPWVTQVIPFNNGYGSASAVGENVLLIAVDPGGAINNSCTSAASCVANIFNPTANPINCSVEISMTRVNGVPPNPTGVQWFFFGGFLWERIDIGPIVYANSIGTVAEGNYGPYVFPVPPGWSTWHGSFGHGVASVAPVPYLGGSGTMRVTLNIIT